MSAPIDTARDKVALDSDHAQDILDTMHGVLHRVHQLPTRKYQSSGSTGGSSVYIDTLRQLIDVTLAVNSAVGVLLNSATRINSLPPELLGCIFSEYATQKVWHGRASFRPFKIPSARASARLTEVCKHWRDVALSTPSLWSGVKCGGSIPTHYERYIRLSRSSPLQVTVEGDAEATAQLFLDQPSRIRDLLMLDTRENWTRRRDPRDLLKAVAPDLLSCTLDLPFWPRGLAQEQSLAVFAGQATDLRELVIHSTKIIPSDAFPSLTHLMLFDMQGSPSLPHILQLLHRCPALEEVCIRSDRNVAQLPTDVQHPTVALPRLRRISLLVQSSFWLISHIEVPSVCLVRLDNITLQELATLSQLPVCRQLSAVRMTRLQVFSQSASPIIQGWTTEFIVQMDDTDLRSSLYLSVAAPPSTPRSALSAALASAFSGNPLFSRVAALWAIHQPTSFVLSPAVLDALPALTMLGIFFHRRTRVPDLGAILAAEDDGGRVICPRLTALCVQDCRDAEDFESIRRIVESRARARARAESCNTDTLRLRRLAIGCAEPLHAHALALHEHVDDLIVRARLEPLPPRTWTEDPDIPDTGKYRRWNYFLNPSGLGITP